MQSHVNYLKYVVRHKWFVLVAGMRVGVPVWQLLVHDWSKFLPCEWFPYAKFFYGMPKIGDRVPVDCIDGFGGVGTVVDQRWDKNARYKVRMEIGYTGEGQEFWAHDFEIVGLDESKAAFDDAWNHHQKCQPHHWQYWLLTMDTGETVALPMPDRYVREMIADWIGAGWAIGKCKTIYEAIDNTIGWYSKNQSRIVLNLATRSRVEALLEHVRENTSRETVRA